MDCEDYSEYRVTPNGGERTVEFPIIAILDGNGELVDGSEEDVVHNRVQRKGAETRCDPFRQKFVHWCKQWPQVTWS